MLPLVWVTSRANVLACFNSVPFSATSRSTLLTILDATWNGYSFRDYVSQPIAPYNVQVRTTPFTGSIALHLHQSTLHHLPIKALITF